MAAAAAGEAPLRLRLLFDFPPPGTPSCGVCWLLLEPSQARLITDLISLIREKFGFSRHAKLSLFLEGALLPPTESARLVRDNDALRVKLEEVIGEGSYSEIANGFSNVSKKQKRRHRQKSEANDSESDSEEHRKRKRSKPHSKHSSSQEENATGIWDSAPLRKRKKAVAELDCVTDGKSGDNTHSKKLKKRDQREREQETQTHRRKKKARTREEKTKNTLPLSSRQKNTAKNTVTRSSIKNGQSSSESSTSSSTSDDNIADTKQKHMLTTKVASQHIKKSQLASPVTSVSLGKVTAKLKDRHSLERAKSKKAKSQSSSSGSDSTSGEEESQQSGNLKNKTSYNNRGTGTDVTSKAKAKTSSSESESSESETYVIKKPKMTAIVSRSLGGTGNQPVVPATCGLNTSSSDNIRGRGRGDSPFWRGPRVRGCRGMFRGRGRGRGETTNSFYNYTGEHQKEQQLNEAATNTSVIIQEGKIVSWNPANKQLELEILSFSSVAKEPGKFDLVYQSADGAETVEYAVSQDRKITESWDALIEPRLIVDSLNNESSTENGNPSNVNKQAPCINSL
ncbi:coilin isoform X2 [Sceloporus undulatus]|uniref:coilin isoform X2 n=1 Tax=Sceloporus undulatus TaxID=8520 RepID=UPI001C4B34EC|nr:coilin isoform X2 [Sceloporus undulatus]